MPLPTAMIRTQVSVPLRFADGYSTSARGYLVYLRQEGRGIGRADAARARRVAGRPTQQ